MDWAKACPTEEEIRKYFRDDILDVEYFPNYPRVHIITSDGTLWCWDKWHDRGFWHEIA